MRYLGFIPLALFLVMGVYFALGLRQDPNDIPSALIDETLPEFELAPVYAGDAPLASTDLVGEVAVLNVFGSWCPPCLTEHPVLLEIAARYDVPLYGMDWREPPEVGRAWLERHGNPYTRVGNDASGRVAIDLGVTGAPESFIIDAAGRVRHRHVGIITPDIWQTQLWPIIETLRAEDGEVR